MKRSGMLKKRVLVPLALALLAGLLPLLLEPEIADHGRLSGPFV